MSNPNNRSNRSKGDPEIITHQTFEKGGTCVPDYIESSPAWEQCKKDSSPYFLAVFPKFAELKVSCFVECLSGTQILSMVEGIVKVTPEILEPLLGMLDMIAKDSPDAEH